MTTQAKRVLVTGGAGFLGSHLCERLIKEGHEVVCLDNFFTGRRANVEHLLSNPHFELFRHDVEQPLTMEVDQIFHLACPASPVHYQRNPVRTIRTAVQGTLNLLEVAREAGARMMIASTSEVYGDPAEHPQRESYWGHVNPIGPRACYDEGKRCAEALAVSYARQYGVDVRIARIFNTYGPRMHENDGRVVSNFVVQALAGQPLTVFGDGQQTRSFCYVSDQGDNVDPFPKPPPRRGSSLPRSLFAGPERDSRPDTGTPILRPRQRPYRLARAAGEHLCSRSRGNRRAPGRIRASHGV
jgi:UDP-glucuronate decarboxylase